LLSPDSYQKLLDLFNEAYKIHNIKVHQTCHIWRHTFAQDLLEATNWNYDLVASIEGWISTDTLKKHYGKMGESIREKALIKAMDLPIEIPQKDFKF